MARNPYYRGPASDHFDGMRFFNPGHPPTDRSFSELWRWRRNGERAEWPKSVEIVAAKPEPRVGGVRATMIGHASVLLQLRGLNILTDPVFSDRVSPVSFAGPKRVAAPGIAFDDLPKIDLVLLSHNHYDHLDVPTLKRLQARDKPRVITALGNDALLAKAVPGLAVTAADWHETIPLQGETGTVTILPAQHWSARGLFDRRMALWCGFMLEVRGARIAFLGDTGYGDGAIFRRIRERHGRPDLALIPIGAYAPRWFMAAQHVDPDEAVRIMRDLDARRAIGIHWGTFQLTDEARDDPPRRLAAAIAREGLDPATFPAASPGETFEIETG